jgi:hypothetical protein
MLISLRTVAEEAWNAEFIGPYDTLLKDYIDQINRKNSKLRRHSLYQTFTSITQSSGCGKSRVVDATAKLIFTIPFNLRALDDMSGEAYCFE